MIAVKVRKDVIDSNPPINDTYDFLLMIVSLGEGMNTGFTGILAYDLSVKLKDEKQSENDHILLTKEQYNCVVKDVEKINFLRIGLAGIMVANYLRDLLDPEKEPLKTSGVTLVPKGKK